MTVERYYNEEGQLGVLVSRGFGAGWSTWGAAESAYDARLVKARLESVEALERAAKACYPDQYDGGLNSCVVEWVDKGSLFRIDEYDGNENIEILNVEHGWIAA